MKILIAQDAETSEVLGMYSSLEQARTYLNSVAQLGWFG